MQIYTNTHTHVYTLVEHLQHNKQRHIIYKLAFMQNHTT